MSIATEITALQTDKTAIRNAILAKSGTCAEGNGFDDFATDIATIPSGGGAANFKKIEVSIPSTVSSGAYVFLSGDSDIAEHYADDSLVITLIVNTNVTSNHNLLVITGCNYSSGPWFKQVRMSIDSNGSVVLAQSTRVLSRSKTDVGTITVNSSGNLTVYLDSRCQVIEGTTYNIFIMW